jgi:hypothetical protein
MLYGRLRHQTHIVAYSDYDQINPPLETLDLSGNPIPEEEIEKIKSLLPTTNIII